MRKSLGFLLSLFTILNLSCGKKSLTLAELRNYRVEFETKIYTSKILPYSMSIPSDWGMMTSEEITGGFMENFTDTIFNNPAQGANLCIISVSRIIKLEPSSLKSIFESNLTALRPTNAIKFVESGESDLLKYKSYFVHFKSDAGVPGEIEGFSFLVDGENDSCYYELSISAPQYSALRLKDDLGRMLNCIKTFQLNSTMTNPIFKTIDGDSLKTLVHMNPNCTLTLYNDFAQMVLKTDSINDKNLAIELESREKGIYDYDIEVKGQIISEGKLIID